MSELILAQVGGLKKDSRDYLSSLGIEFDKLTGGEVLTIELHKVPSQLRDLERHGYFAAGERHIWHVERFARDGIKILVGRNGALTPIVIPCGNVVSAAIAPYAFQTDYGLPAATFSSVARQAISPRDGVPRLSRIQIEMEAEKFLFEFAATRLRFPAPTELGVIVKNLTDAHGINFDLEAELGYTAKKKKILGRYELASRAVAVDRILGRGSRFNFTLAHELGHVYLHSYVRIKNNCPIEETRNTVNFRQKAITAPLDWLEWQANTFAAGILMPAATVPQAVVQFQKKHGVTNRRGIVFLDEQPFNQAIYRGLVRELQHLYRVSASVASIRLKTLEILQTEVRFEPRTISEFLRTS